MKNLNVLLGVVFGLIVGAGAVYVGMGTPTEQPADETAGFTTQSVRGGATTATQKTTTTAGPETNGEEDVNAIKVEYHRDGYCKVYFDDGGSLEGKSTNGPNGNCCNVKHTFGTESLVCYYGNEQGVKAVEFGGQGSETNKPEGFTTQSVRGRTTTVTQKTTPTGGTETNGEEDVNAIKVSYGTNKSCRVEFDYDYNGNNKLRPGDTSTNSKGEPCCYIADHNICYTNSMNGVKAVEFGGQGSETNDNVGFE